MKYLGIFLIIAGLLTAVYTFNTGPEKHEGNKLPETTEEVPFQWWPLAGLAISAVGATVVWFNNKKKKNSVSVSESKEDVLNKPDDIL